MNASRTRVLPARQALLALPVLGLAGLLAGCGGDGSGLHAWFHALGGGSCSRIVVDVDLRAADSVFRHDASGAADCLLHAALAQDGCEISTADVGTDKKRIVISGCTLPADATLFRCDFLEVDFASLQAATSAQCTCLQAECDATPAVCVNGQGESDSCEAASCANGRDDDGDGRIDCSDEDCEESDDCRDDTTSTTTTSLSSTTSTTADFRALCNVRFRLLDDVTVGSLEWTTDYSAAPGSFLGEGGDVDCGALVPDALAAFNDVDADRVLRAGIVQVDGLDGPASLVECTFGAFLLPFARDFQISVTEAASPDLSAIVPPPAVEVSVTCDISATTTSTSTTLEGLTTTTVEGQTTTTTTSTTSTTTTLPAQAYTVLLSLESATAPLGALQIAVDYASAPGGFLGSGPAVACEVEVGGAIFAWNDVDALRELRFGVAVVSTSPMIAPLDLARCEFRGSEIPTPEDFEVTVVEAADPSLNLASASVVATILPAP